MTGAALRPGRLGGRLATADVHYPLTVPVPPVERPTVLTLLDVQHLDSPALFPTQRAAFSGVGIADWAARRASHVVVISEWVRERVVERLGLDLDRVHAIHLVDHRFTPDPAVERRAFLYYPARPWPHKNHARLYEARSRECARPCPSSGSS